MLLSLLALMTAGLASAASEAADGPNLLTTPGFELPYAKQCCQTDLTRYYPNEPIDEVQVAHGWTAWWLQPDQDAAHPSNCPGQVQPFCTTWRRPEWRDANCGS